MSKCKICNSDLAITGQINAMLEARVKLKVIAAEIPQFSVYQLSRHRNRCLGANSVMGELSPDAGSDELRLWMQRCTDSYHLAVADGDSRSAIAACSAATRQLEALHKKMEKEALAAKDIESSADPSNIKFTIQQIDALIRHDAESGHSQNGIAPRALTLASDEPSFRQLVQVIWADRSLLPMLLAAATTDYLTQRETTTTNATAND